MDRLSRGRPRLTSPESTDMIHLAFPPADDSRLSTLRFPSLEGPTLPSLEGPTLVSTPNPHAPHASKFAGPYGQLTPCGGGDPIPLVKDRLLIGRRPSCDIQLKFANVSGQHCKLTLEYGYWFVRDLNSRNGTKVDNRSIVRKRADPKCKVSIAKHDYILEYEPQALGAYGPPPPDDDYIDEVMKQSLMDRAGLKRRDSSNPFSNRKMLDD